MGEGFFLGGWGGTWFLGGERREIIDQLSPTEYRVLWGPRIIDCN